MSYRNDGFRSGTSHCCLMPVSTYTATSGACRQISIRKKNWQYGYNVCHLESLADWLFLLNAFWDQIDMKKLTITEHTVNQQTPTLNPLEQFSWR